MCMIILLHRLHEDLIILEKKSFLFRCEYFYTDIILVWDKCIQCETKMKDTNDKDMPYKAIFAEFSFPDCFFHILNKCFVVTFMITKICRKNEANNTPQYICYY